MGKMKYCITVCKTLILGHQLISTIIGQKCKLRYMNSVHVHIHVCEVCCTLHHWIDEIEHIIFVLGREDSILLLDDGQVKIFQGNSE